ncbi:hypothetical protein EDC04DRAFT_2609873 [Pisolithus marmoratus]|nr:hypothetical protein EDC04DRAFT_2609873 [Pisolithus marmoratus]
MPPIEGHALQRLRRCPSPARAYKNTLTLKKHMKNVNSTWVGPTNATKEADNGLDEMEKITPTGTGTFTMDATTVHIVLSEHVEEKINLVRFYSSAGILTQELTAGCSQQKASGDAPVQRQVESLHLEASSEHVEEMACFGQKATDPIPVLQPAIPPMILGDLKYDPMDGLLHKLYLEAINIVVDPKLKALCCKFCQIGLIPGDVLGHIHGQHKGLLVNKKDLDEVLANLEVCKDIPEPCYDRVGPPFKGLKVSIGRGCQMCSFASSSNKYIQTHYQKQHSGTPMPNEFPDCKMQQLSSSGKGHCQFQVQDSIPPIDMDPETDFIMDLREEMGQAFPPDDMAARPGRNSKQDDDKLLPGLKEAVRQYFDEVLSLLQIMDELVLQHLNSPDPKKSINNMPFHHHQCGETMANYTLLVMALIWMLARAGDNCSYCPPLPNTLCTKMLSLVTLERDGKHKEPKSVTHYLSKLEYCMCLVFLKELKQQSASSFGQDDEKASSAKAIVTLWEQRVLQGINMCISYDALADDIDNCSVGYSFLVDRQNTCFADHDSLAHKFLTDPSTSGHFGVKRNGRMIWDKAALQRWLADYAEFQEQLLLHCETLSSAPGHGMELMPLTFCNTRERPQWNLVILGKYVALLCSYHKSAAITGLEKLIPHVLDGLTGNLIIQSLAIAWPFAELASYICYPHKPDVLQLYKTQLFVNHKCLFTTENISHSMAGPSLEHLPLGQFAEELLEMDENDTLIMHVIPGGLGLGYVYSSDPGQFQQLARAGKLGLDPQHEIPGKKENGTDIKISEEKIADQVAAKLEKKFLGNLEALLTDRLVTTIGPAIQTIVKDAVQEALTSISTNLSANHGKTDAPPTNSANWDMMYMDPSPPATSDNDVQLTPKEKGQANNHHNDQGAGPLEGIGQRNHGRNKLVRQEDAKSIMPVEEPNQPPLNDLPHLEQQCLQTMWQALNLLSATWISPQQRKAMLVVAHWKTDVVAMLKMGGGKSMLAAIPALLKPKEAIVVVLPLKSLMTNLKWKLEETQIPYQEYICDELLRADVNFILVSVDHAMMPGW